MGINEQGLIAERKGRLFLIKHNIYDFQQLDWLYKHKNEYGILEVKARELFEPPPFLGTGADIKQINKRMQLKEDLGIDTILLVFEKGTNNIYYQKLNVLMDGKYHDTKNNIRIFPISNFIQEQQ